MKRSTITLVALCVCAFTIVEIAAAQQQPVTPANVAGAWAVTIYGTPDGTITQQWTIKQTGGEISGTVQDPKKGEMAVKGKFSETNGASLRGTITEGQMEHLFIVSVTPAAFDGTFRVGGGRAEFLIRAKRTK